MTNLYASFRHLMKMTERRGFSSSSGDPLPRIAVGAILYGRVALVLYFLERMFVKKGLDPEKVKRYSLNLFNS